MISSLIINNDDDRIHCNHISEYCDKCFERYDCMLEEPTCDKIQKKLRDKLYHFHYDIFRTDCRTGNLDPNSTAGFGYITRVLVSKFLGTPTCFETTDIFNYPGYDILDKYFGRVVVMGSKLSIRGNYQCCWRFYTYNSNKSNRNPDFYFCIGFDENRRHVERVYIIPNLGFIVDADLDCIYINKNWSDEEDQFYWFRGDEQVWDRLYHSLRLENCPILRQR